MFGQAEAINQLDSKGKRNGKWIEYPDAKWKVVKDSSAAVYYRYAHYDHGVNLYGSSNHSRLNFKLESSGNSNQAGKIKMLDGEYKWLDKKGRVVSIDKYNNGEVIWSKNYSWHVGNTWLGEMLGYRKNLTGTLHESYDFTKKYKEQPYTFYIEIYDTKGKVKTYYSRSDIYGWCAYEQ